MGIIQSELIPNSFAEQRVGEPEGPRRASKSTERKWGKIAEKGVFHEIRMLSGGGNRPETSTAVRIIPVGPSEEPAGHRRIAAATPPRRKFVGSFFEEVAGDRVRSFLDMQMEFAHEQIVNYRTSLKLQMTASVNGLCLP